MGELSEVVAERYRIANKLAKIGCGGGNVRGMWRTGT
jgi:hypothetical protein